MCMIISEFSGGLIGSSHIYVVVTWFRLTVIRFLFFRLHSMLSIESFLPLNVII